MRADAEGRADADAETRDYAATRPGRRDYARALLLTLAVIVAMGLVIALVGGRPGSPEGSARDQARIAPLTAEELATVRLASWETWTWGPLTHYIAWVEAPGLDLARARVSVTFEGTDGAGDTHVVEDWAELRAGEQAVLTGAFYESMDAPVEELTLTAESGASRAPLDYRLGVTGHSIETVDGAPVARLRLLGSGTDSTEYASWVTVVVRSGAGEITHLGRHAVKSPPRPGSGQIADVILRGPETVGADAAVEVLVSN